MEADLFHCRVGCKFIARTPDEPSCCYLSWLPLVASRIPGQWNQCPSIASFNSRITRFINHKIICYRMLDNTKNKPKNKAAVLVTNHLVYWDIPAYRTEEIIAYHLYETEQRICWKIRLISYAVIRLMCCENINDILKCKGRVLLPG
jgi:hypothetical protein